MASGFNINYMHFITGEQVFIRGLCFEQGEIWREKRLRVPSSGSDRVVSLNLSSLLNRDTASDAFSSKCYL